MKYQQTSVWIFDTMTSSRRCVLIFVYMIITWGTKQESLAWLHSTFKASKCHSCLCYLFVSDEIVIILVIACFAKFRYTACIGLGVTVFKKLP